MSTIETTELNVDRQQNYDGVFPKIIACQPADTNLTDVQQWIAANKDKVLDDLSRHGAILFRDFPVRSDMDFDSFIQTFGMDGFTYQESLSNAVRRNRTERVFTANEAPPDVSIFLHHEMAQTPLYPSKLFFYCEKAAEEGGATPICRSDILLQELEAKAPQFIVDCEAKGVRYSNNMPAEDDAESGQGRSWKSTLSVSSKEEAEDKLQKLGYRWRWLDDGSLRVTTAALPAVRTLADGRRVFFNQLIAAYRGWKDSRNDAEKSICFGDDSEMDAEAMALAIQLGDELSFDIPWQTGDVALVDNFLAMHGRRPFSGQRRVLASLIS
jgi:alpha-ketoglutarate-dependent taurine dioxygenase